MTESDPTGADESARANEPAPADEPDRHDRSEDRGHELPGSEVPGHEVPEHELPDHEVPDDHDLPDDHELPDHDVHGLDMAARVAHRAATGGVNLPAPKGVGRKPSRQRRRGETEQVRSGARPDERDPQQVGDALSRMLDDRGWTREINLRTLLVRWAELVGPVNAAHSAPESYADAVLTIRAESTTWATSLRSMARPLVAELNSRLGDGTVERIVVLGPTAPSWKKGPRSVRDGRGPRDTYG